jgi:hypothetical protein
LFHRGFVFDFELVEVLLIIRALLDRVLLLAQLKRGELKLPLILTLSPLRLGLPLGKLEQIGLYILSFRDSLLFSWYFKQVIRRMTDTLCCGVLFFHLLLSCEAFLPLVTPYVLVVERGEDAAFRRIQLYIRLWAAIL